MKKMTMIFVGCAVVVGCLAVPGVASAEFGYVCEVYYNPYADQISIYTSTEPHCEGSLQDFGIIYGENSPWGTADWRFPEYMMTAIHQDLIRAMIEGYLVDLIHTSGNQVALVIFGER